MLAQPRQQHQTVKVAIAVTPGFSTHQFQRLPAIRFDLSGNTFLARVLKNSHGQFFSADKQRIRNNLHIVISAMIVFCGCLIAAILTLEHPLQESSKPFVQTAFIYCCK